MRPRQPFNNPEPSGSAASCPAAPMASANAGARSSASRPTSPSTVLSSSSVTARRPRSREPEIALSRSSKVSLLPASETRDDRLMFCASASDGLRSNSGARLTPRSLRLTLALGSAAHGSAVPCASASSPAPAHLDVQPQRRTPHARHRSFKLRRAFARRDRAIEPQQDQPTNGRLRQNSFEFDAEFAAPERIEIDPAQRRDDGLAP